MLPVPVYAHRITCNINFKMQNQLYQNVIPWLNQSIYSSIQIIISVRIMPVTLHGQPHETFTWVPLARTRTRISTRAEMYLWGGWNNPAEGASCPHLNSAIKKQTVHRLMDGDLTGSAILWWWWLQDEFSTKQWKLVLYRTLRRQKDYKYACVCVPELCSLHIVSGTNILRPCITAVCEIKLGI